MPASSVLIDLFTAIDARFTGDAPLMSLITGVFQQAPDVQPYPYITLGNVNKSSWVAFQKNGAKVLVTIDIWTDIADGDKAVLILAECDRLLDQQPLSLANYDNVQLYNDLTVDVPEEGQRIRHITARYLSLNSVK